MDKLIFVSSTTWKRFPDGTSDDRQYLMKNLEDYDPNEDHLCGFCGRELGGRFLFCDASCEDALFE